MATRVEEISDSAVIAAQVHDFNVGGAIVHAEHQQWLDRRITSPLAGEQRHAGRTTSTQHPFRRDCPRPDGALVMWVAKHRAEAAGDETEAARIAAAIAAWGKRMGVR